MSVSKSKYTHDEKKEIAKSIENLKNNDHYREIFKILSEDPCNKYVENSNGIYQVFSALGDDTLDKINIYLAEVNRSNIKQSIDIQTIKVPIVAKSGRKYRHKNSDKNILKQQRLKKLLDQKPDYEVLQIQQIKPSINSSTKSTKTTRSTRSTTGSTQSTKSIKSPTTTNNTNVLEIKGNATKLTKLTKNPTIDKSTTNSRSRKSTTVGKVTSGQQSRAKSTQRSN